MKDCKKIRLLLDDVFFKQISEEDKNFLDRHLKTCSNCREELEQNNSLLAGIIKTGKSSAGEPPAEFWENYSANLHQRMLTEGVLTENDNPSIPAKIARWFTTRSVPGWALQAAAAVLLVILGIFIGRLFFPGTSPAPQPASIHDQTLAHTSNNLLQRTGNFIDRSRVILLAIENTDLEGNSIQAINLPYQKEVSRDLLKSAAALKQELDQSRRRRLQELIAELEVILLQIANMDAGSEMETLQLVKGDQHIRGMLYKIRINDLRRSIYRTKKTKKKRKI